MCDLHHLQKFKFILILISTQRKFLFIQVPYMWLQPLLGPSLLAAGLGFPAALSFSLYKAQQLQYLDSLVWELFFVSQDFKFMEEILLNFIMWSQIGLQKVYEQKLKSLLFYQKCPVIILFTNHIYISRIFANFYTFVSNPSCAICIFKNSTLIVHKMLLQKQAIGCRQKRGQGESKRERPVGERDDLHLFLPGWLVLHCTTYKPHSPSFLSFLSFLCTV